MRGYNMKLNPGKCAFGVSVGKFLGFMVTQRRIEVNLDQIQALHSPIYRQVKTLLPHIEMS
ncbi:hypothetical protein AAG906_023933 [Vitis piasezkii]